MKVGTPTNNELDELSRRISYEWKRLARRLGVTDAVLGEIDEDHEELSEKGYHMLIYWKQTRGSAASYNVLCNALRHPLVQRRDLAEMFC